MAAVANTTKKVIFVGNSGAGKSFLANAVLRENHFKHRVSAKSVTDAVEHELAKDSDRYENGTTVKVYNIPGLVEADPKNIERNKKCLKEAFTTDKDLPTSIFFVMGVGTGGRIRNEDVDAWKAINDFLEVSSKKYNASITIVVNQIPLMDAAEFDVYTTEVSEETRGICGHLHHPILFVETIPDPKARNDFSSPAMLSLTNKLAGSLKQGLSAAQVISVDPAKEVELAADVLKKQNKELHEAHEKMVREFHEQRKQDTQKFRDALAKQQEENAKAAARDREEWQRTFSNLNEELSRYRKEIDEHKKELEEARKNKDNGGSLGGILPFLLHLVMARDNAAQQVQPACMGGGLPIMMEDSHPFMNSLPRGARGASAVASPPSTGGLMGWHAWRTAASNAGRHYSREEQSDAYQAYKKSGKF